MRVSPSWVEPLAQPPTLVEASTSVAVMTPSPLVSTILPGPWLTALFRSANVMTPSPLTSVRFGSTLAGISAWLSQTLLIRSG